MMAEFSSRVHSGIVIIVLFLFGNAKVPHVQQAWKHLPQKALFCDEKQDFVTKPHIFCDEKILLLFLSQQNL